MIGVLIGVMLAAVLLLACVPVLIEEWRRMCAWKHVARAQRKERREVDC